MMLRFDLVIRNARTQDGRAVDVGICEGRIAAMDERVSGKGPEYDAAGQILGPDREVAEPESCRKGRSCFDSPFASLL